MTGEQSMVGQARRRAHCMSSLRSAVATFALFAMTAINAPSVRAADLAISELERAPAYDDTCLKTTITYSGDVTSCDLDKLRKMVEGAKAKAEEKNPTVR